MEQGWILDGIQAQNPQQARDLWRLREDISEATAPYSPYKNDISVRIAKVPEFLREPIEAAQARLEAFEEEAQKVFKDLVQKGRESRKDFAELVQRLSKQDWAMGDLRDRVSKLREHGMERAQELKGRAETFRADALERLEELQTKTVAFLGVATRADPHTNSGKVTVEPELK